MAIIYHYPKCSTCRKALKWVKSNEIQLEFRDITKETPSEEELIKIIKDSGLEVKKFFNTSGRIYKERNLKEVVPNLSIQDAAKMLSDEGMLIKRPLYVSGNTILVGFKESDYEEKLLK